MRLSQVRTYLSTPCATRLCLMSSEKPFESPLPNIRELSSRTIVIPPTGIGSRLPNIREL